MANTRQELGRAFELIRNDQLEEAIKIVKPITESEPENADAWWLLANAASEPRDARRALVNALKINPSYPKARDLLDKLNELHPPRDDELMMMMEIEDVEPDIPGAEPADPFAELDLSEDDGFNATIGPPSSEIDDLFSDADDDLSGFDDDDFGMGDDDPFADLLADDDKQAAKAKRRSGGGRSRTLLLFILVIVLVAAAAFLVLGQSDDDPEPTAITTDDTGLVALEPIDPATINPENAEQLESIRSTVEGDAQSVIGPESAAYYVQVEEGYGLLLRVCADPTPDMPDITENAMRLVAGRVGVTSLVQDDLAVVGVSVLDCTRVDDVLYRRLAPMVAVVAVGPNIRDEEAFNNFQETWIER